MNGITSAIFGFIFTALLFAICLFLVIGVKVFILSLKATNQPEAPGEQPQETAPPNPKPKKPRLKSIRIDPDEVDRIYVRK